MPTMSLPALTESAPRLLPPEELGANVIPAQNYTGSPIGAAAVPSVVPGHRYWWEKGNSNGLLMDLADGASGTTATEAMIIPASSLGALTGPTGQAVTARLRPVGRAITTEVPPIRDITSPAGTPLVATPAFSPSNGSFVGSVAVTITCATSGAQIRYTTDGSTPTGASSLYSAPITLASTTTLKAIGIKSGLTNSPVATKTYTHSAAVRWGSSASATLNESAITGLENSTIKTTPAGVYSFAAPGEPGEYYYLAWPDTFVVQPRATDGFTSGGLPMSGDLAGSGEGYSQSENGWEYALVSVGGVQHRVYRTLYTQTGTAAITVNV